MDSGAGIRLEKMFTPEDIRWNLGELVKERSYTESADLMSDLFKLSGGIEEVVSLVRIHGSGEHTVLVCDESWLGVDDGWSQDLVLAILSILALLSAGAIWLERVVDEAKKYLSTANKEKSD